MKLKRFQAINVHGYLNFDIEFDDNLTFLIGINGSGKTSAIRIILGLLSPSWFNLTQINYDLAEIECEDNGETIVIRSESIDDERMRLHLIINNDSNSSKGVIFKKIVLPEFQGGEYNRIIQRQYIAKLSRYEAHFAELDIVKKIRELITPIYLGLDRRIHEGSDIDLLNIDNYSREKDLSFNVKSSLYESLQDIENLIKNSFLDYSQKQTLISNDLKNKIIYSSFDVIKNRSLSYSTDYTTDISLRKQKILDASKNFEITGLDEKILTYFTELKRIQENLKKELKKNKSTTPPSQEYLNLIQQWFINSPQLQRIDNIIHLYEEAQLNISRAYEPFLKFEELANSFFAEGNKSLKIKKNGFIEITLPNKKKSYIHTLSSGEKQILVMLAQLIFGKHRQIFIIDEPELSLHLGWQDIFVPALMQASEATQFILATHSPSIIGTIENEKYCVDLSQIIISDVKLF